MPEKKTEDVTPSRNGGIMKTIIKNGEGFASPGSVCKAKVHYTGTLTDGTIFDTSRSGKPYEFDLGRDAVIKGWEYGIPTMRRGEIASFECKPEYGYGKNGNPPKIPPKATLNFEIELIDWKEEDLSLKKDGGILKTVINDSTFFSSPKEGSTVNITITGRYNGQIFDDRDVVFTLGEGSDCNICEGLEKALEDIKIKEKSRLQIKSAYAFGSAGCPKFNIPPNADIEYTVELNDFKKLKDVLMMTGIERITHAEIFKEKGTKYFKKRNFSLAAKMYKKIEEYVGKNIGFSEEEGKQVIELVNAMHLNTALCYLKTDANLDARDQCDKVLEKDPDNKKALFRRGQSFMNLGEPALAKRDFERILVLDPKNKAVIENIQQCNETLKKHRMQEKKVYTNMFGK